jgi:hypothetical protein
MSRRFSGLSKRNRLPEMPDRSFPDEDRAEAKAPPGTPRRSGGGSLLPEEEEHMIWLSSLAVARGPVAAG